MLVIFYDSFAFWLFVNSLPLVCLVSFCFVLFFGGEVKEQIFLRRSSDYNFLVQATCTISRELCTKSFSNIYVSKTSIVKMIRLKKIRTIYLLFDTTKPCEIISNFSETYNLIIYVMVSQSRFQSTYQGAQPIPVVENCVGVFCFFQHIRRWLLVYTAIW